MKSPFDTQALDIPCPSCGQKTAKTVAWLKARDEFACPACGRVIQIDAAEFRATLQKVEQGLAKIGRSFRKR